MKKLSILKAFSLVLLVCTSILLTNCSSDNNDSDATTANNNNNNNNGVPTTVAFKPADFSVLITNKHVNETDIMIEYDIKNLTNVPYVSSKQNGDYALKFTVKTSDGALYQKIDKINDLDTKITSPRYCYLTYTNGKQVDMSTFTMTLVTVD